MSDINEEKMVKKLKNRRSLGIGFMGLGCVFSFFATTGMKTVTDSSERLGMFVVPLIFFIIGIYLLATKPKENKK